MRCITPPAFHWAVRVGSDETGLPGSLRKVASDLNRRASAMGRYRLRRRRPAAGRALGVAPRSDHSRKQEHAQPGIPEIAATPAGLRVALSVAV